MKKLSELKISPTPWRVVTVNGRLHSVEASPRFVGDLMSVATVCSLHNGRNADARLIAAATELYQELWFQCFGNTGVGNCHNCKGAELGNCKECPLGNARAALAKASGEVK